ncbi:MULTISPECIES: glycerol-3-phosphate dehydrogenase/oxidase [Brevibacillus]|jgi:Glycerol-3-phosphate dehydrogenase|uniref:glycerol-3-phosphate dehydrogenase/oxidase n=1 Tax=Brevibacillus TaxID=55080 RepID=UPI000EB87F75|nr:MULTISPECIES: glycerol-3-phosphate dehydrogenase/oxidase [Brevibacillus]MDR4998203.1 glycerol-3-phosphate dehydrogenase/oxidase [Brevibacillus parabrevis]NRQ53969.1 glycerol-3-phosphate dehydrogenase/oxidase [Brevibacillus sp. HD1.4A]UED68410.1 glycerol-3-phosphate dehydrogenase/oxidase [Brevibacillus sp. HD3.3A]WDV94684.1 glycerol-3-phosphate dehydrogenase/oxidase [Brevibacillus parabrevis]HBZ79120.1 glycerol-3-phosphate dehydrogenase [Brevibacillus sp.]
MNAQRKLSSFTRQACLEEMASKRLDLLIIGGGVTGAGIALDAASRGLTVGLVEKQDFAAGTSSRSTKLVHGGLRYLKQGDVQLVREVGRERAILYRNAPHIVIPEKMILPIVEKGTYGKLATSVGLYIYDVLAGVERKERRIMLNKQRTMEAEPLLRTDILKGGGLYFEYRTDDARLTVEVMKTARAHGALCTNYTEATEFIYENGKVTGIRAKDLLSGSEYELYAKKIVNAAGPWVDQLREKDRSLYGKRLHLTKGVHLVVPYNRLPLKQSVYFDVSDGRMLFAIPRNNSTYIGTTDTNYQGVLERPTVTREDMEYVLRAANEMFPTAKLTEQDVSSSWAGLRPLIHEDGKSPSELSRKDEIFYSNSGLITIAGGKLTGFRKMAERIVDVVAKQLTAEEGRSFKPCQTDTIVLSGGEFASGKMIPAYVKKQAERVRDFGISEEQIRVLVGKFGSNSEKIVTACLEYIANNETQSAAEALLLAELHYALEEEMVMTVSDFLIRRTGRLFFERDSLESIYPMVADELANKLHADAEQKDRDLKAFAEEYHLAKTFQ